VGSAGVNTSVPNVARIYDYILGGMDNGAVFSLVLADLIPPSAVQHIRPPTPLPLSMVMLQAIELVYCFAVPAAVPWLSDA
jgi:hypothetical protein